MLTEVRSTTAVPYTTRRLVREVTPRTGGGTVEQPPPLDPTTWVRTNLSHILRDGERGSMCRNWFEEIRRLEKTNKQK